MNALEMIYQFELLLDTLDATVQKPKTADTLDWINLAQSALFGEAYKVMDFNEEAKKLLNPFQVVDHVIDTFNPITDISFPNTVTVELPENLKYITREALKVNVDMFGRLDPSKLKQSVRDVRPITADFYNANKRNPLRNPNYNVSWRLDLDKIKDMPLIGLSHMLIMGEGVIPIEYYVSYLMSLPKLTEDELSTSLFPDWFHDNIVKRAVSDFMLFRGSQREPVKTEKQA